MRLFTLFAGLMLSATALAQNSSGFYLGGSAHIFRPDAVRSEERGVGGGIHIGVPTRLFLGRGSFELGFFGSHLENDGLIPDYSIYGAEALLRGILAEEEDYSTFMIAGLGYNRIDRSRADGDGHLTGGLGLLLPLGDGGLSLRAEARMYAMRTDISATRDMLFEYRGILGLEYAFLPDGYARTPLPVEREEIADEDGDGVSDADDRCPGTPPGAVVDARGCTEVLDADGDGVLDADDRCPDTPAGVAVDRMGCPPVQDADGDGITDPNDRCANTPPGVTVDLTGCPPPLPDSDGDGVPNPFDRCPGTPPGEKVDHRGCKLSNDSDGDGVPNDQDRCPDTAPGMKVDEAGCVVEQSVSFNNITFEFNSSQLTAQGQLAMDLIADGLLKQTDLQLLIGGHADAIGSAERNLALSQKRAQSVAAYLTARGVDAARLRTEGHGESRPVASNDTPEGRALNRRVEFVIKRE